MATAAAAHAASLAASKPKPATAASRKRKSTEAHASAANPYPYPYPYGNISLEEDINLNNVPMTENCDQIRRKINRFIDAGAATKTAFARNIGVSAKSLSGFLGEHGAYKGSNYAAYQAAWEYFKKREIVGLKMPTKKLKPNVPVAAAQAESAESTTAASTEAATTAATKKAAKTGAPAFNSAGVDISDIHLPGEETDRVPVYDSCDEVRRKINAHLKKPGVTQAQFCRDILAQLHAATKPKNIQSSQLARFRGMKGANSGATSSVYYGAYVFFEKVRVKEGKAKTKHRSDMEELWKGTGMDREHDGRTTGFWCMANERPVMDQYGKLSTVRI
ncbi:hypothetical protein B0T17DRAFT_531014 [Bombardia bombarda]|uniref:DUF7726 domain-containing protein n=1 Tax=Bombardia bombarda TaxID=252184 RepID=A0AA39X004_9PEZI|nr:hypothetical protein B0T17DRAFT_531014 [Bombardia bombarda]